MWPFRKRGSTVARELNKRLAAERDTGGAHSKPALTRAQRRELKRQRRW